MSIVVLSSGNQPASAIRVFIRRQLLRVVSVDSKSLILCAKSAGAILQGFLVAIDGLPNDIDFRHIKIETGQ